MALTVSALRSLTQGTDIDAWRAIVGQAVEIASKPLAIGKRRQLMLTLHEAHLRDQEFDIEGRERLTEEARELIHEEYQLSRDSLGRSEVDRVLADLKYRFVRRLDEEAFEMPADPTDPGRVGAVATLGARGDRHCRIRRPG